MTSPIVYVVPTKLTSPKWGRAFAIGCGGTILSHDRPLVPNHSVAMFGAVELWPLLTQARNSGVDWFYGDHGYFNRRVFYRCTKNALQHSGLGETKPDRFLKLKIPIADWRKDGAHILVCPPDDDFAELMGFSACRWIHNVSEELKKFTDRKVRFRPRNIRRYPLALDLKGAWALVTYVSNAAVEAVLQGVPVFCLGECAASAVGRSELSMIETPLYPDNRLEWASVLASNQWAFDEMKRGDLWRAIGG